LNKKGTEVHWIAKNRIDHGALRRLAAVLLTLAAIAESISQRSAPFRGILLWLLCRAEARARDFAFIAGAGTAIAFRSTSPVCRLGSSGEAALLVQRFRALAAGFLALARQASQFPQMARRSDPVCLLANRGILIRPDGHSGLRHRSFTDTS
jgi:hypothetical protein